MGSVMIRIWDGALSVVAALVTLVVTGIPTWGAFLAVRADMIGWWAWPPIVGLGIIGAVITLSFFRKAGRGVHPLRERRR